MKMLMIVILGILGILVVTCISACSTFKEERFRNKLVDEFRMYNSNFNNKKFNTLKVDDLFIIPYIINYNDYSIYIPFCSYKKQKIYLKKILIGNKEIVINKKISIDYKVNNNLYCGKLQNFENKDFLSFSKTEIFEQVKSKQLTITIHFVVDGKEKNISIDMEQYTVRDIVWPT